MNAKKAKRIRKALKQQGIDAGDCILLERKQHIVTVKNYQDVVVARTTAQTNFLAAHSGRSIYKQIKKANA